MPDEGRVATPEPFPEGHGLDLDRAKRRLPLRAGARVLRADARLGAATARADRGPGDDMIYTEVESHRASLRERWALLSLVWRSAGDPDVPVKARRGARRLAIRHYVLALRPRAATYIVNRNGDA